MENIEEIKSYFKKLQRVLNFDVTFTFGNTLLIKKEKIDDILCCILAILPKSYKKMMHSKEGKKLTSVICYNTLFNALKRKFIFNPSFYLVDKETSLRAITTLLSTIEKDLVYSENNA